MLQRWWQGLSNDRRMSCRLDLIRVQCHTRGSTKIRALGGRRCAAKTAHLFEVMLDHS